MYLEYEFKDIKEKNWTVRQLDKRAREVAKRRDALNQNFEWSEKNVAHLKKLFTAVNKLQNTIKMTEEDFLKVDCEKALNRDREFYN